MDNLQQILFKQIKSRLASHASLADEVAELLNISNDSAYRRIRGEKELSLPELQKISSHFKVSIDRLMQNGRDGITFFGRPVEASGFSFIDYLKELVHQLTMIKKSGQGTLYYEAKDILPFYHFQFPELARFKYFFWMKTILSYPEFNKVNFEDAVIDDEIIQAGNEIISLYSDVASVEIWNVENLHASIRQIDFYDQAGVFRKKSTAENLCRQLGELLNHLEQQAELGEKFVHGSAPSKKNNFKLFYNETFFGHNTLFIESGQHTVAYLNYGVLNYLGTTDENFCNYIRKSFENTMHKSGLISSVNEKGRSRFFGEIHRQIEKSVHAYAVKP